MKKKRPKRPAAKKLLEKENQTLEKVLDYLNIQSWDFLIIGDGSGSNWQNACGWASVSIEKETMERRVWYGAMNKGTVNLAEMMAYIQPLNWLLGREEARRHKRRITKVTWEIHIVTDSQYVQSTGSSGATLDLRKNGILWHAITSLNRLGLNIHWHWLEREGVKLNSYADRVSKLARKLIEAQDLTETEETSVHDLNASED